MAPEAQRSNILRNEVFLSYYKPNAHGGMSLGHTISYRRDFTPYAEFEAFYSLVIAARQCMRYDELKELLFPAPDLSVEVLASVLDGAASLGKPVLPSGLLRPADALADEDQLVDALIRAERSLRGLHYRLRRDIRLQNAQAADPLMGYWSLRLLARAAAENLLPC